jgi:CRP/FNR family transcriptional regulator, cyclic AMP receptor protein
MATDPFVSPPMSDSLRALARRGELRRFRKGQRFIVEGEFGDTLYIVLEGRVRAFGENAAGHKVIYNDYGPGEYVGEMSLDGGPRSAHVEALQATLCARVTRVTLQQHLAADPAFAFELLAKVIRRARAATVGLAGVALNNVYGQLKMLLEVHAVPQPDGSALWAQAPNQTEIAQFLGCTKSMVNKVMRDLQRGGLVALDKGSIRVLRGLPQKW